MFFPLSCPPFPCDNTLLKNAFFYEKHFLKHFFSFEDDEVYCSFDITPSYYYFYERQKTAIFLSKCAKLYQPLKCKR